MAKKLLFRQTSGKLWLDGDFIDYDKAMISVQTHGLHYGSSVFEGERAYGGEIFKSRAHTDRLIQSCRLMGFELPYSAADIESAKRELRERSGIEQAYVRPVAWRGSEQLGVSAKANTIHAAIAIWEMTTYFADKMKGIRLTIADWRRPPSVCAPVKAKAAGLYMICTLSKDAAAEAGYDDALMLDYEGRIAECTGAHIFFVRDGELHTPSAEWILDGITRATVMEIANVRGLAVHERHIMPDELPSFSECFIVGSAVEITPVNEIKGISYTPADISRQMIADYDTLIHGETLD
ncbi:MAG: branched-chain amino acid aminotransferase [Robiginitomaculum sp.]|nr:branched-chain amino acid aminotransferase [Robiginitomaculum sp.]MDQ7077126.1 branched-chain amino acid aminotransferase [Robiginitomaculum sp.]